MAKVRLFFFLRDFNLFGPSSPVPNNKKCWSCRNGGKGVGLGIGEVIDSEVSVRVDSARSGSAPKKRRVNQATRTRFAASRHSVRARSLVLCGS